MIPVGDYDGSTEREPSEDLDDDPEVVGAREPSNPTYYQSGIDASYRIPGAVSAHVWVGRHPDGAWLLLNYRRHRNWHATNSEKDCKLLDDTGTPTRSAEDDLVFEDLDSGELRVIAKIDWDSITWYEAWFRSARPDKGQAEWAKLDSQLRRWVDRELARTLSSTSHSVPVPAASVESRPATAAHVDAMSPPPGRAVPPAPAPLGPPTAARGWLARLFAFLFGSPTDSASLHETCSDVRDRERPRSTINYDLLGGKVCSRCRIWKPFSEFPSDRTHGASQGYRHCRCRACHSEVRRAKKRGW